MKTPLLLVYILLLSTISSFSYAQCDGRYETPIFENVTVTQDIQYGLNIAIGGEAKVLHFDFYEPTNDALEERPLVIMAHGGTFVAGDENSGDIVELCTAYAKRGYACASINYRLLPIDVATTTLISGGDLTTLFFEEVVKAVADMRAAIRYFRQDAATTNVHRIDPNQIFVGGMSAGAILAIHVAYFDDESDVQGYTTVPTAADLVEANGGLAGDSGNDGYEWGNLKGVIDLAGAIGSIDFIQDDEPGIVSIHGNADDTVPYGYGSASAFGFPVIEVAGSAIIYDHMQSLGVPSAFYTIEGGNHTSPVSAGQMPNTISFTSDFIYTQLDCYADVAVEEVLVDTTPTISVYPNPVSQVLSVNLNYLTSTNVNVLVYDNLGRLVKRVSGNTSHYVGIDCSDLTPGLYHVQVQADKYHLSESVLVK